MSRVSKIWYIYNLIQAVLLLIVMIISICPLRQGSNELYEFISFSLFVVEYQDAITLVFSHPCKYF